MAEQKILVVDDDPALAEMLGIVLRDEGFELGFCADGSEAFAMFRELRPHLVLLDLMLPGKSGIEVCEEIRAVSGVPIIMLTAKGDPTDVVLGLESGADDYIAKPFDPKELVARIRTRLRPARKTGPGVLKVGDITIETKARLVRRGDEILSLTPLEYDLLVTFASKPLHVFTREKLLEKVWGFRFKSDTRLVNVHVQRLRAKIERDVDNPVVISTVRGVGYRASAAEA